jgi:NitT/TauT family transport system ATP-binding protein
MALSHSTEDLSIRGIRKSFSDLKVLDGIDLDFPARRVTAILGPSGCGKSTLMSILAGLVDRDEGSLGTCRDLTSSCVFQEPRLLPWHNALENVALPLRKRLGTSAARIRAAEYLRAVGLEGFERSLPSRLSGGMRQRVSLARAFAYPGELLLLDEPFQSLDLKLRLEIIDLLKRLLASYPKTVVFVTHDPEEALYLGDAIAVLSPRPSRVIARFEPASAEKSLAYGQPCALQSRLYEALLGQGMQNPPERL